jgi:hypothetical protein
MSRDIPARCPETPQSAPSRTLFKPPGRPQAAPGRHEEGLGGYRASAWAAPPRCHGRADEERGRPLTRRGPAFSRRSLSSRKRPCIEPTAAHSRVSRRCMSFFTRRAALQGTAAANNHPGPPPAAVCSKPATWTTPTIADRRSCTVPSSRSPGCQGLIQNGCAGSAWKRVFCHRSSIDRHVIWWTGNHDR